MVTDEQGQACPDPQKVKVVVCTCEDRAVCSRRGAYSQPTKKAELGPAAIGLLLLGLLILLREYHMTLTTIINYHYCYSYLSNTIKTSAQPTTVLDTLLIRSKKPSSIQITVSSCLGYVKERFREAITTLYWGNVGTLRLDFLFRVSQATTEVPSPNDFVVAVFTVIPLLLLFCTCGLGDALTGSFTEIPVDTKSYLINYHTEGQGENTVRPTY